MLQQLLYLFICISTVQCAYSCIITRNKPSCYCRVHFVAASLAISCFFHSIILFTHNVSSLFYRVLKDLMEEMAYPEALAPLAPLGPLDSEE